jgi:hypothetical protein
MRYLRREPRRDPSVRLDRGGGRAHLERARGHPLADERRPDDDLAVGEEAVVVVGRARAASHVRSELGEEQDLVLRGRSRAGDDRQPARC